MLIGHNKMKYKTCGISYCFPYLLGNRNSSSNIFSISTQPNMVEIGEDILFNNDIKLCFSLNLERTLVKSESAGVQNISKSSEIMPI